MTAVEHGNALLRLIEEAAVKLLNNLGQYPGECSLAPLEHEAIAAALEAKAEALGLSIGAARHLSELPRGGLRIYTPAGPVELVVNPVAPTGAIRITPRPRRPTPPGATP